MTGSIRSIRLPEWWDPARVFHTLYRESQHAFWLDAGARAQTGLSYLGAATERSRFVTSSVQEGTVTITVAENPSVQLRTSPGTIFDFLRDDLADANVDDDSEEGGFRLGWVGWLGYELGGQTVGTPVHNSRYPEAALLQVDRAIAFDHAARTVTLLALQSPGDPEEMIDDWADSVRRILRASSEQPIVPITLKPTSPMTVAVQWRHDAEAYGQLIRRCQSAIRDGDAYQLCLTNEIRVDVRPDPIDTYLILRAGSPSHHGGFLRFGDTALLSSSPEQFLAVTRDGMITTKPIKGTRRRSTHPERDRELQIELESSEKERAENLMIVDLMRNDLGRIAEVGSVAVSKLLSVESYAHVHQLVSTIEARMRAGVTAVDVVASCFPAGSMTGAPKISAMTILDGLEGGPRGIYSGAFGYFGLDGAVDLAMVIRSIVLDADGASIGTGGGITALSVPLEEIEETRIKAAALLEALGVG